MSSLHAAQLREEAALAAAIARWVAARNAVLAAKVAEDQAAADVRALSASVIRMVARNV